MQAHSTILTEITGRKIDLTIEDFSRYIGNRDSEIFYMYKKDFNVEFDFEDSPKIIEFVKNLDFKAVGIINTTNKNFLNDKYDLLIDTTK